MKAAVTAQSVCFWILWQLSFKNSLSEMQPNEPYLLCDHKLAFPGRELVFYVHKVVFSVSDILFFFKHHV